jgi:hypothetical protein
MILPHLNEQLLLEERFEELRGFAELENGERNG